MRVVIVGGGVIGCSIAYHLAKAGTDVILLERGEVASEASGAAAGMTILSDRAQAPGPFRDLCLASLSHYPELIGRVERESGVGVQGTASGILVLAETPERLPVMLAYTRLQQRNGSNTQWVQGQALREL